MTTDDPEAPFTLVFVGYVGAEPGLDERASAYEDAVLPLLADHGAELVYRGRRVAGQDPALPLEVHLTRFPHRRALDAYMADDRRAAPLEEFGEVFTAKQVVEMDTVETVGTDTVSGTVPVAPSQEVPAENYAPTWAGDTRTTPPLAAGERETLTAYLEWHRQTFELKCAGVPSERLSDRGVPPSGLSLHGLVRHLAGVERWWFRIQFAGEDVPLIYYSDDDPNQDFDRLDGDVAEALAVWRCGGPSASGRARSSPGRRRSTRRASTGRRASRSPSAASSCTSSPSTPATTGTPTSSASASTATPACSPSPTPAAAMYNSVHGG
jgi:hypothetical protein